MRTQQAQRPHSRPHLGAMSLTDQEAGHRSNSRACRGSRHMRRLGACGRQNPVDLAGRARWGAVGGFSPGET